MLPVDLALVAQRTGASEHPQKPGAHQLPERVIDGRAGQAGQLAARALVHLLGSEVLAATAREAPEDRPALKGGAQAVPAQAVAEGIFVGHLARPRTPFAGRQTGAPSAGTRSKLLRG